MFFGLGVVVFIAALLTAPYRLARLLVFLDPWSDARAGGFQIIQSYLGFQNGGVWGVGLGESKQKLFFLPEAHTDFILSVIGEEFGLFGVLLICACFAYMVFLGLRITLAQDDTYRQFLAFGLTMLIGVQAALNMGVTMGLLPTKGMTLPLVSNGSNSLIVFLIAIAILARISQESADIPSKAIAKLE
jgi:cell division protein FtsW